MCNMCWDRYVTRQVVLAVFGFVHVSLLMGRMFVRRTW